MPIRKTYGWRRSIPDFRDRKFAIPRPLQLVSALPPAANNSSICVPAMDQGSLGSCVPHATSAVMRSERIKQGLADAPLSRLQLYYDARDIEGTLASDAGVEVRTAIKCAANNGLAPEGLWPYNPTKWNVKPTPDVYAAAKANEALQYMAVDRTVHDIKAALASRHCVVFGISVFTSFESDMVARTGIIPYPNVLSDKSEGGHCMYLHSYDDRSDPTHACGRNSWGNDWGVNGDFTIPWNYLCNHDLAADFWLISKVG